MPSKIITLTILIVFIIQNNINAKTINIILQDRRNVNTSHLHHQQDTILIYNSTHCIKKIKTNSSFKYRVKLKDGSYTIKYRNQYSQLLNQKIMIDSNSLSDIILSMDSIPLINTKSISFIESMLTGDSLMIFYESKGCFHQNQDSLVIIKSNYDYCMAYHNILRKLSNGEFGVLKSLKRNCRICNISVVQLWILMQLNLKISMD